MEYIKILFEILELISEEGAKRLETFEKSITCNNDAMTLDYMQGRLDENDRIRRLVIHVIKESIKEI